jgi:predicted DNA-binding transcriptional regulator AlpA
MQETTVPYCRLRTQQAARYVGLSKSTLEKYRVTGGGPVYASLGRIVVYESSDLDHWVNQRKRASTSEALRDHG